MTIEDGMDEILQDEFDHELIRRFVDADSTEEEVALVAELIEMGLGAHGIHIVLEALKKEAS